VAKEILQRFLFSFSKQHMQIIKNRFKIPA
jgi:hypothetical protein